MNSLFRLTGLTAEKEQQKRESFLNKIIGNYSNKPPTSDIDKIILLLVHLLRKFTSFYSSSINIYQKNYDILCNEILNELKIKNTKLNQYLNNNSKFEQNFKKTCNPLINKADLKDRIVNEFWNISLAFMNNDKNNINTDSKCDMSRYENDYREIEVLGKGGFGWYIFVYIYILIY